MSETPNRYPRWPGERRIAMQIVSNYAEGADGAPWAAERTWELELGPSHDTAEGLHAAMLRACRAAPETRRAGICRETEQAALSRLKEMLP